MAQIVWTKKALSDLKRIHEFISADSVFYADRFILKIASLVDVLEKFPLSGRVVPEFEDSSVHEIIEGNYRIFYKLSPRPDIIYILRVYHAARKVK